MNRFVRRPALLTFAFAFAPVASLSACEGEPPVMAPVNSVDPKEAASAQTETPPEPSASAASVVAAAPSASGAPKASTEAPAPAAHRGSVTGTVTTQPPSLKGLAVVFLEDGPGEDPPGTPQTITITNRKMTFAPYVAVASVGAKVVFANEDPFPHNVFSPDNEKFNMGPIAQNGAHVRVFKAPGPYSLLCNLHPGMLGYLYVTPSSWHVRTDARGHFELPHVPGGTYKVTAWAPRQTPVTQTVTVGDGEANLNFDLHR